MFSGMIFNPLDWEACSYWIRHRWGIFSLSIHKVKSVLKENVQDHGALLWKSALLSLNQWFSMGIVVASGEFWKSAVMVLVVKTFTGRFLAFSGRRPWVVDILHCAGQYSTLNCSAPYMDFKYSTSLYVHVAEKLIIRWA